MENFIRLVIVFLICLYSFCLSAQEKTYGVKQKVDCISNTGINTQIKLLDSKYDFIIKLNHNICDVMEAELKEGDSIVLLMTFKIRGIYAKMDSFQYQLYNNDVKIKYQRGDSNPGFVEDHQAYKNSIYYKLFNPYYKISGIKPENDFKLVSVLSITK